MLTKIFVTGRNPDVVPQDVVSGRWSDFNQGNPDPGPKLKCDPVSGYEYYEDVGRLHEIPFVLDDLAIVKVTLDHRSAINIANACDQGRYESSHAFGYTEHTITWNREKVTELTQYISVTGETLDAANHLMDAIISGGIAPVMVTLKPRRGFWRWLKAGFEKIDPRQDWSWV